MWRCTPSVKMLPVLPPLKGSSFERTQMSPLALRDDAEKEHFSGVATYRTTFDWPGATPTSNSTSRVFLDLGKVAVMAQVKLNDRDLGTVWTPPFRVDVTDALRSRNNALELR